MVVVNSLTLNVNYVILFMPRLKLKIHSEAPELLKENSRQALPPPKTVSKLVSWFIL